MKTRGVFEYLLGGGLGRDEDAATAALPAVDRRIDAKGRAKFRVQAMTGLHGVKSQGGIRHRAAHASQNYPLFKSSQHCLPSVPDGQ
jgi:hypothetical protein